MTEKRHRRGFGPIILRREGPPQLRRQAQRRKHVGRDLKTFKSLRFASACQLATASVISDKLFENLRLRLPEKVTLSVSASGATVLSFRNPEEPLRLIVGYGIEQHRIHDAENRRVRADAERQREDGNQCNKGMLEQHSRRVA